MVDFKMILVDMVLPVVLKQLETEGENGLDALHAKDPELVDTLLIFAHRAGTAHGQRLVDSSANTYDDKALASALEIIKVEGAKFGITFASVA